MEISTNKYENIFIRGMTHLRHLNIADLGQTYLQVNTCNGHCLLLQLITLLSGLNPFKFNKNVALYFILCICIFLTDPNSTIVLNYVV